MLEMEERCKSITSSLSRSTSESLQHFTAFLACLAGGEVIDGGEGPGGSVRGDGGRAGLQWRWGLTCVRQGDRQWHLGACSGIV
jgi:hypothetical protein